MIGSYKNKINNIILYKDDQDLNSVISKKEQSGAKRRNRQSQKRRSSKTISSVFKTIYFYFHIFINS